MKFTDIKLSNETKRALEEMNFTDMMPIQEQAIPHILAGRDVIGQAQTGTGKTGAFGIPLIESTNKHNEGVEHLILAPTRELAVQIVNELEKLNKYHGFRIVTIIGGADYNKQRRMLRETPHFIVATPGRIIDHLKNKKISLDKLKTFTIDEADEMLRSGFKDEVEEIISFLPEKRQSLLFSATMSKDVMVIINELMNNPVEVKVSSQLEAKSNIEQFCIVVKEKEKFKTLTKLLTMYGTDKSIIFGRTKKRADELASALSQCGYNARAIHGDLTQPQRLAVMRDYRSHKFNVLVATDVAARGLDISDITHVYNFDLPQEIEYYVHRIGRTGRAGNEGTSITFAREEELPHIKEISKQTNSEINIVPAPTDEEVKKASSYNIFEKFADVIREQGSNYDHELVKELINKYGAEKVVGAAISLNYEQTTFTDIKLTGEPPVRNKNKKKSNSRRGRRNNSYHRRGRRSRKR